MARRPTKIIRTTCPRDCYDSCGLVVERRKGAIVRVWGDPDHPVSRGALCGKCALAYNGAWRDPKARLTQPLRRTGAKGEGRFTPITWSEALETIAARLKTIVAEDGPESILNAHYTGTCSVLAGSFPLRFFNRLGATEITPDTICNNAGHVALRYLYGTSVTGFDPRTAKDARTIVVWGCNPSASAPHAHKHWLAEAPGRVVVVDPVRTKTAAAADLHLQLRPGSDAALAFAMLHVLVRDDLIDHAFLAAHALGWDELEPTLAECTPGWGARATGVPAARIVEAARMYGTGPALLWLGQGMQRQPSGGNAMRAVALLPAATGNLGKPGAGFCFLNGKAGRGIDMDDVAGGHLRRGPQAGISHMDLADRLADPGAARALFCWNINIAASNPRQADLRRALAREDLFTVVIDLFATDTVDFADIVLPAASFLEFDDVVASYFHLSVSAQTACAPAPGEALPNQEIFRRLAAAMGFEEVELFERDADILARLVESAGIPGGFEALAAAGTIYPAPDPVVQFAGLEFPTPSGRVEIASARAEADGQPRLPRPHADPPPADGRLRLLSPASPWLLNSSYANEAKVARQLGAPRVWLHPDDAARLGIVDGQQVVLENQTGALRLAAAISDTVAPGVALAHKSRWPKREGGVNVNFVNPGHKTDMGESSAVHGTEVTLRPA